MSILTGVLLFVAGIAVTAAGAAYFVNRAVNQIIAAW